MRIRYFQKTLAFLLLALSFLLIIGIASAVGPSTILIDLEEECYTKAGEKTVFLFDGRPGQGQGFSSSTGYLWEYKLPGKDSWVPILNNSSRWTEWGPTNIKIDGTDAKIAIYTSGNLSNSTLIIENTPSEFNGIQFRATIGSDNLQSKVATLYVYDDVKIKTAPTDTMAFEGNDAFFSVEPISTTGVTYQWYKGPVSAGNIISGANESTLVLENLQMKDAGTYTVVVTGYKNKSSKTVSANLTVFEQPTVSKKNVAAGEEVTFSINGGDDYTYQWYKGEIGSGETVGGDNQTYKIEETKVSDAGKYYVTVKNTNDATITSDLLELNVVSLSAQPEDVYCFVGNTASFEITAPSSATETEYQWYRGTPDSKTKIEGATNSKLEWTESKAVSKEDEGTYFVVVTKTYGTGDDAETVILTSETANLTVFEQPTVSKKNVAAGEEVTFSINGGDDYTYQWYKGEIGSGETVDDDNQTYKIEETKVSDAGKYYVTITINGDTLTSDLLELNVVSLSAQPEDAYCFAGNTISFEITAPSGTTETEYQWYKETSDLPEKIEGATGSKLEWTSAKAVSKDDEGTYFVVVTQTYGTGDDAETVILTSETAQLTVFEQPAVSPKNVAVGEEVEFSVSGDESYAYQWYKGENGPGIAVGTVGRTYTIEKAEMDSAGKYYVTITINGDTLTSDLLELNVVSLSAQPEDVYCFVGNTASFEITAPSGTTETEYQWYKETSDLPKKIEGATNSKLEWTESKAVSKEDEGTYFVVVTKTYGTGDDAETVILTSETAQLTVFEQPAVSPKNVAVGEKAEFSVSGDESYVYQWYKGEIGSGIAVGNAGRTYTIEETDADSAGKYYVTITINGDTLTSDSLELNVVSVLVQPADTYCFVGNTASFEITAPSGATETEYQWYKETSDLPKKIEGATNSKLEWTSEKAISKDDEGTYFVVVTQTFGTGDDAETVILTSETANLTVFEQPTVSKKNVAAGEEVEFSVSGDESYAYQWYKGEAGPGIAVGTVGRTYTIEKAEMDSAGKYYVTITINGDTLTSDLLELNVVSLSAQPEDVYCFVGNTASFEITAPSGTTETEYQWYKETSDLPKKIEGATNSKLEWTESKAVSKDDEGTYFVVVTQTYGTGDDAETVILTSETAQLTVFEQPAVSPKNVAVGEKAEFSVSGDESYVYQWYKGEIGSGIAVGNAGRTYTIEETDADSAGKYYVTITINGDTLTSDLLELNVVSLSEQPEDVYCFVGNTASFEITAPSGATKTEYQWYKETSDLPKEIEGATNSKLEWTESKAVSKEDDGTYFVVVTQTYGTGDDAETVILTSETANLTVFELACTGSVVDAGDDVTFSVVGADGNAPDEIGWTYAWYENDGNGRNQIADADGTEYKIENIAADKDGFEYTVRMENGQFEIEAAAIQLTVIPKPDGSNGSGGYGEAKVVTPEKSAEKMIATEVIPFAETKEEMDVLESNIEGTKMKPIFWIVAAVLLMVCTSFLWLVVGKKKKHEEEEK